MNAKDIIQLNNEQREKLSEENLQIYEDMLIYIRLKSNKSEQQTEEVLLELLDHMLEAQAEGKKASDIFGEDYKGYCDELIKEIPGEKSSTIALFLGFIIIQFIAIISFVHGALGFALHYFFELGSDIFQLSLGKGFTIIIIDLLILYLFVKVVLKWIQGSAFKTKKPKKSLEFFQIWLISTTFIGSMVLIGYFMPDFGLTLDIPIITFAVIGAILYLISIILNKRYRITK
ncbi:DUF1129 family protein [Aquibacillus koreensis]|uniref:DUF1129 family protein n=1 Tax=Aquibacillus koreensis TaxID=279446 RepID=A0A9X4AJM4_9BACI|nr:DUF1129 family protein [Aquibacillus koreensis]MCT2534935.1 DUF1129 family protein [Aquibacillus koreensis]MDC3422171.1 DUF1129 family protein [Aquibacillus koreensis]